MILPSPTAFLDSRNIQRINSKAFFLALSIGPEVRVFNHFLKCFPIKSVIVDRQFLDLLDDELLLFFDDVAYPRVVDGWMDKALHHGSSLVVFDVAFPSLRRHPAVLAEALLSEITQSKVVSVCHQIFNFSSLHLLYINKNVPLSLFINRVPKPLICSVEVIARKAI